MAVEKTRVTTPPAMRSPEKVGPSQNESISLDDPGFRLGLSQAGRAIKEALRSVGNGPIAGRMRSYAYGEPDPAAAVAALKEALPGNVFTALKEKAVAFFSNKRDQDQMIARVGSVVLDELSNRQKPPHKTPDLA